MGLAFVVLLAIVCPAPASADSFASLNLFGFPAAVSPGSSGGSAASDALAGLSGVLSTDGQLSASSASHPSSGQGAGYFGAGLDGMSFGAGFAWPTATHDASTIGYERSVAYEANLGNDAISFLGSGLDISSLGSSSSFPTIKSDSADIKYAENVQLLLSTESDTMPLSGFSFPAGFGGFFG